VGHGCINLINLAILIIQITQFIEQVVHNG
jgi:hypothetical protein